MFPAHQLKYFGAGSKSHLHILPTLDSNKNNYNKYLTIPNHRLPIKTTFIQHSSELTRNLLPVVKITREVGLSVFIIVKSLIYKKCALKNFPRIKFIHFQLL